jgi:hypothetical protein
LTPPVIIVAIARPNCLTPPVVTVAIRAIAPTNCLTPPVVIGGVVSQNIECAKPACQINRPGAKVKRTRLIQTKLKQNTIARTKATHKRCASAIPIFIQLLGTNVADSTVVSAPQLLGTGFTDSAIVFKQPYRRGMVTILTLRLTKCRTCLT